MGKIARTIMIQYLLDDLKQSVTKYETSLVANHYPTDCVVGKHNTKTAIRRRIRELRAQLLELDHSFD